MDSLFILIPIALIFVIVAIGAFIWAVNGRQYDDLDAAANSILFDDVEVKVARDKQKSDIDHSSDDSAESGKVVDD